jgi:hypothetical protein
VVRHLTGARLLGENKINMMLEKSFEHDLLYALSVVKEANRYRELTVIAGGALRDHLNGKFIKDIDVFIRTDRPSSEVLADLQTVFMEAEMEFDLSYADNPDVAAVIDLRYSVSGIPIQVILLKRGDTREDILQRIDLGICQVGYDEDGLFCTKAFTDDFLHKTMTIVRCDSAGEYRRSIRRFERLSEKYINWTLSAPPLQKAIYGI